MVEICYFSVLFTRQQAVRDLAGLFGGNDCLQDACSFDGTDGPCL